MNTQFSLFSEFSPEKDTDAIVNVASVPQRSPFRYPGGKTWLIPTVRQWLTKSYRTARLIEPFAGGAIVSLTAAFEKLADHVQMIEKDEEVAAVWEVIIHGNAHLLAEKILNFNLTHENIQAELAITPKCVEDIAFCTILKNRVFHGGILAKGAGLVKNGENGKGLTSRWYPKTLHDRIRAIAFVKNRITFQKGDAFEVIEANMHRPDTSFFIDPPYTIAGRRLYTYFDIDHEKLFQLAAHIKGPLMITYDDTPEIRKLADQNCLPYRTIPMKTTHHLQKLELIISNNFDWW